MRIDIVGLPGSGKSTLAAKLATELNIPHIQIDHFWFEAGGRQGAHDTPDIEKVRAYVRTKIQEAVVGDAWVSDGVYSRVQDLIAPRADVLIFLDIPLLTRILAHTRRAFFEPRRHSHLTWWDEVLFYREIIRRTFRNKAKILKLVEEYKDKAVVLRSYKEVNGYCKQLLNK